jgi:riboflavin transporter FmnP
MRFAARTVAAGLIAGAATAAVALFSASRLADAPTRGRAAGPDPIGSLASLIALGVAVVAFWMLGRSIRTNTKTASAAVTSGLLGGALAGLIASVAQAFALSEYLSAVLAGYAVPPEFLAIALRVYVVLAMIGAAVIAAAITYAGWYRSRASPPG